MAERAVVEADVAIVGLGAAGGVAAHVLCASGLTVAGIEAGPYRSSGDFRADELESSAYDNDLGPKFNREIPVWEEGGDVPRRTATASPIGKMVNAVGGSSIHFAGWSRRFQSDDFRAHSNTLARYGASAMPVDCTLTDWPLTYDVLEPYYTLVEDLLGISGVAGVLADRGATGRGGNSFESPRQREYPLPPLRRFLFGSMFSQAASELGYHPYPVPVAVLSADYDGRPACSYCGWCIGQGCPFGSKSSTLVTAIPKASDSGRLQLHHSLQATKILVHGDQAVGVSCVDSSGDRVDVFAQWVILSAYTFENVRLLFLSDSARAGTALGNERGQLGKHFMARQPIEVFGEWPDRDLRLGEGPSAQAVCIDDLTGDNFNHQGMGFIRGGTIAVESEIGPIRAAQSIPPWIPRWGKAYKEYLVNNWRGIGGLRASPEPLPYLGNELSIDWTNYDSNPAALPRVLIRYHPRDNEARLRSFLAARMTALAARMGARGIWTHEPRFNALSGHDLGGLRMGHDPAESVVDPYGRVHETSNLYVLGGATFPTAGVNPTLTIQALAWRTAEHIARLHHGGQRSVPPVAE